MVSLWGVAFGAPIVGGSPWVTPTSGSCAGGRLTSVGCLSWRTWKIGRQGVSFLEGKVLRLCCEGEGEVLCCEGDGVLCCVVRVKDEGVVLCGEGDDEVLWWGVVLCMF